MKKRDAKYVMIIPLLMVGIMVNAQNKDSATKVKPDDISGVADTAKVPPSATTSGGNRNLMLSATSNNEARQINVGIPAKSGGVVIFENDLPIVIYQNAEYPARSWRNNASIASTDLQSVDKVLTASNFTAYGVNSYTRLGGDKLAIRGSLTSNTFGLYNGDINISGPLSKKHKLFYSVGVYYNSDPGSITKSGFNYLEERTDMYNIGLTKRFKRGEISLLYKYSYSAANTTPAAVFMYQSDGSVSSFPGFSIGTDSYQINTGKLRFLNPVSGEYYWVNLSERGESGSKITQIDLTGKYDFGKNWNLKYTFRYHSANISDLRYNSTNTATATAADAFKDMYGNTYTGLVQGVFGANPNHVVNQNNQARIELTKKYKSHLLGLLLLGQYYDEGKDGFHNNRTYFYQTVEAEPSLLIHTGGQASTTFKKTDAYGFYNYNNGIPWHRGTERRFTVGISDKWNVSKKLNVTYGLAIRSESQDIDWSTQNRGNNFVFTPDYLVINTKNYWNNLMGNASADYLITKYFGTRVNLNYFENCIDLDSYQTTVAPLTDLSKTTMGTFEVYYNHPKYNIVSGIALITKTGNNQRINYTNPGDGSIENVNQSYDTRTIGWTTDIILKPVRNFALHYMLTIQNPVYTQYQFTAFGKDYNYDDKVVLGISKVLQEIDPSYTTSDNKIRIWASIRTFSKQYANYPNALFFKGWFETFFGMNYQLTKGTNLGIQVTNPLNQRGAKGTIKGAELITDPSPYYNQPMVASYIIPFNISGSIKFNF